MNGKIFGLAILALAACGSANAAELLITEGAAKKGSVTSMALDVVSDGDVRAFDFVIPVSKGVKVDTSKCLIGLPKGFQGGCQFNGTEVAGIAYSLENTPLPKGVHSIGSVVFSGRSHAKTAGSIQFNAADANANAISTKVATE